VSIRLLCVVVAGAVLHNTATIERTAMQRHAAPAALASASLSADGRTVAFESLAQLDPRDTNADSDIYVLDIPSGRIEFVSIGPDREALSGGSIAPSVSGDGRYVVFESVTPVSQPACMTLFLRDRQAGATRALTQARRSRSQLVCANDRRSAATADGWHSIQSAKTWMARMQTALRRTST
jgi:hypothetical protein